MPHIRRDVVSHSAVTARQRTEKFSVPIGEADCCAVKLQFAAVAERRASERLRDALGKSDDLGNVVSVAEREHRIAVSVLRKFFCTIASNVLGGGVRRDKFRISFLKLNEFIHQVVILEVTERWSIVHIIASVALGQDLPEFVYPPYVFFPLFHILSNILQIYQKIRGYWILVVFLRREIVNICGYDGFCGEKIRIFI